MTPSGEPRSGEIVYLVRSWPRLSQTFVLDEVRRMQRAGVPVGVVALTASGELQRQAELDELAGAVRTLDDSQGGLVGEHLTAMRRFRSRYLRAAWHVARHREWDRGYHAASRWRCLTFAIRLADLVRADPAAEAPRTAHLHAHFAHDPAAVAMLTHLLTGIPWSFTGHARDVWQVPPRVLAERVRSSVFAVTCSAAGRDELLRVLPSDLAGRVRTVPHGVDVDVFRPGRRRSSSSSPVRIVSVGRLVEKKGFDDLVDACAKLRENGQVFTCTVYGDGPLHAALQERVETLDLTDVVRLAGPRIRAELLPVLQNADIFALTPQVTADGDRDGIPNALLEAMACGLPVVATVVGGVPEAVHDGVDGLLARPADPAATAAHLETLIRNPGLRRSLGTAARRTAVDRFDSRVATRELAALFARVPGDRTGRP